MQGFTKLLVFAALAFGAYYFYNEMAGDSALEGTWRSNKEASLLEAEKSGVSEGRRALLARQYGKMTYEIEDGIFKAKMGEFDFEGPYEVTSKTGDCYSVKTSVSENEVCIRDGRMYVYVEAINSYEVFDKL